MLVHTPTVLDDTCLCNFFSSAICFLDRELVSNIQVFLVSLCAFKMQTEFTLQHIKVVSLSIPFLLSPTILFAFQTAECRSPILRLFNTIVVFTLLKTSLKPTAKLRCP